MQEIYQTIAGYFQDDDADELTSDPVFNAILDKDSLGRVSENSLYRSECSTLRYPALRF